MVDSQPHPAITSRATASVGLKRPVLLIHVFIVTFTTQRSAGQQPIQYLKLSVKREVGQGQAI